MIVLCWIFDSLTLLKETLPMINNVENVFPRYFENASQGLLSVPRLVLMNLDTQGRSSESALLCALRISARSGLQRSLIVILVMPDDRDVDQVMRSRSYRVVSLSLSTVIFIYHHCHQCVAASGSRIVHQR